MNVTIRVQYNGVDVTIEREVDLIRITSHGAEDQILSSAPGLRNTDEMINDVADRAKRAIRHA